MDLFNKKKIKELESRIRDLEAEDKSIWAYFEQEIKKQIYECPKYFQIGDSLPEDSCILHLYQELRAIKDYLKIDVRWQWEDDPNQPPPKPKQIRVWRAEKRKRIKEDEEKPKENK